MGASSAVPAAEEEVPAPTLAGVTCAGNGLCFEMLTIDHFGKKLFAIIGELGYHWHLSMYLCPSHLNLVRSQLSEVDLT